MPQKPTESLERDQRLQDVVLAYLQAVDAGQKPDQIQLVARHPDLEADLRAFFSGQHKIQAEIAPLRGVLNSKSSPPFSKRAFGNYVLLKEIGHGGMGIVYKAQQISPRRIVALKMVRAGQLASPEDVRRFRAEAETAASLDHPNIVPIYEVGECEGQHYFTMKRIEGGSLAKHLGLFTHSHRASARLLGKVARAIHHGHQRGILHRDLKPANILLDARGRPHVTDFGLAKRVEGDASLTQTGVLVGTPSYMSPEQAAGKKDLTIAVDVYGLGAILYELLTGRPPFHAPSVLETVRQVLEKEPARPRSWNPRLDQDLETICLKCLEKEPRKRYRSAEEVADRLQWFLERKPIPDRRITGAERLWRWCRRNPILATTGCLASVAIIAVVSLSVSFAIHSYHAAQNEIQAATDLREKHGKTLAALEDVKNALEDVRIERRRAQDRLVEIEVAEGVRLMDEGDLLGSLPWFVKALKEEQGGPERERIHLMRVGAVWRQCPRLVQFWLHDGPVAHAEFSPDGKRVVTASYDWTARVWDIASGQPVTAPLRHKGDVRHASFSRDGRRVVTASGDGSARVWDAQSGQPVTEPLKHNAAVWHATFSPDGKRVVTASTDQTARVWDAESGQPVIAPLKHNGEVWHAAFSPDGLRAVTASMDQTARVWNSLNEQPAAAILKHSGETRRSFFSPDGRLVITASMDQTARVWDAQTGQPVTPPLKHNGAVWHAAFSPDGKRVVTASWDHTARVWDAQTGQPVTPPLKHNGADNSAVWYAAFSPDGRRVVTASLDQTARIWDAQTGELVLVPLKHNGGVWHAAFSPDGRRVVTACGNHTARIWDVQSGQPIGTPMSHNGNVPHAAFSPNGGHVVTVSRDRTARVWDAQSGRPITAPLKHNGDVEYACFSSDGRRVVTASKDYTARVWDAQNGQPITPPLKHKAEVVYAAFSPDDRLVITTSWDYTARVWDAQSGQPVIPPLKHNGRVLHAAFSPDGRRAVTASADQTAQVWDIFSGGRLSGDLSLLAELVSDEHINANLPAPKPRLMAESWQTLHSKYPVHFSLSTK
jgi:WD40 repeat protein/tRNA A-37 threonylcarbamoyl transferase component Bud32